jgi:hypothetical protein
VAVTVVLADGFDGGDVELTVDGRSHLVKAACTSPLTGMADELVVEAEAEAEADAGAVQVSARLADTAPVAYTVPPGATLVLNRTADGLSGRVHAGPVGFG